MNKAERIFRLDRLLKSKKYPSLKDIADELHCSVSTVNRDKQTLLDFFCAPLKYDPGLNGYYYDESEQSFDLPGFWFSPDELFALLFCHQVVEKSEEVGLRSLLEPMTEKIEHILENAGHSPKDLKSKIKVMPLFSRSSEQGNFSEICAALINNEIINAQYLKRSSNLSSGRKLHPQKIVHYKNNWYLAAYCEKRSLLRLFALENLKIISTEQGCIKLPETEVDEFIQGGFGVFSGKASQTAVLRFFQPGARWVEDEFWHHNEKKYYDGDDLILEIPYSVSTELVMEILRHGDGVVVESPETLRKEVINKIKNSLKNY